MGHETTRVSVDRCTVLDGEVNIVRLGDFFTNLEKRIESLEQRVVKLEKAGLALDGETLEVVEKREAEEVTADENDRERKSQE